VSEARAPRIVEVVSGPQVEAARELLVEYRREVGADLCFASFDEEMRTLPGAYAPARGGRFYLALHGAGPDERVAGCVALRSLDADTGEMKRLYVRQDFRGLGYGRVLVDAVIRSSVALGHQRLVLDTLPGMVEAQTMYLALGFRDIPPYMPDPVPGARILGLELAHLGRR
jgi:GNAT superfamily N-acetyltransferase